MSNIIGVDYGRKHIGLAIADAQIAIAGPISEVTVVGKKSPAKLLQQHLETLSEVGLLIIGLPEGLENKQTEMSKEVEDFANELHKRTEIPYILWNETMTSALAARTKIAGVSEHSEAARIILQDYLDHERTTKTKT